MTAVTFTDFRKQASGMLSKVEKGETVIILRHGKPIAEISPYAARQSREPAWQKPGLRLSVPGAGLSQAILEEREMT